MRPLITACLALLAFAGWPAMPACAQSARVTADAHDAAPALAAADRIRLAEAFRLADAVGDRLWPGWGRAPFAVLLVTADREFLLGHPRPSGDFARVGHDTLLGTTVFTRPRVFAPTLLATFPAVAGVPTIVIGDPANTGLSSTRWVLTLLHEHFHQHQSAHPDYYPGVAALDLARGDTTGAWMLDFAFPYDSSAVQARFAAFARALDSALARRAADPPARRARAARMRRAVSDARARLRAALSPADDRYLAFQMWQEGVARYTELHVARLAATPSYAPSRAFRALPDFTAYAAEADAIERGIRAGLRDVDLAGTRRVAFYAAGAATALMLDGVAPAWRTGYLVPPFALEPPPR